MADAPNDPDTEATLEEALADIAVEDSADGAQDEATDEPSLEERLAAAEDRALRFQAETQNVLNRTRRELADQAKYGALGLAKALLPAIDNLDRALAAVEAKSDDADSEADPLGLVAGFRMVREQLLGVLSQHGCEPISPEAGEAFDPAFHEAILQQPSDDVGAGSVMLVAQVGYRMHDRVVRAAQVIVSSGPAAE